MLACGVEVIPLSVTRDPSKMSNRNRVAVIQMASSPNLGANLLEVEKLVGEAVEGGAGLVVLPENFAFLGLHDRSTLEHIELPGKGPLQGFLAQLAERHGIWLVGGTIPLLSSQPDKMRAACLVFNAAGEQVARYDKIHLFDVHLVETNEHYRESATIEPGDQVVVVDSPFGRLGLAVCYDLRFPELFRKLTQQGAEVFLLPAAFTRITGAAHWASLCRARAIENLCYMAAAAQGGYHKSGRETYGHSMVVSPWGEVLGELQRGSGSASGVIDLEYLHTLRRNFPSLEHGRIDCV